jgi:ribosomal protein S18 acetylase RimI-like enzyme
MSTRHCDLALVIRPFQPADERTVIDLWHQCGLTRPWNDPHQDVTLKMAFQPELFFVGTVAGQIVATVMAGYEGHRGWINYLGVAPAFQRQGIGSRIMRHAETALRQLGCVKINLQVRESNQAVIAFYERLGFSDDHVLGLGKRLSERATQSAKEHP